MTAPTLAEFLLDRIAAVEERVSGGAQGAQTSFYGWHTVDCGVGLGYRADEECACRYVDRVLADCQAKRRIVEEARNYSPELSDGDNGEWALDMTLRILAAVYADHPDYDEAWRA